MTREELRDYVEEQRNLKNIPYHVYSALIDGIDTLEQEPCDVPDINVGDMISRQAVLDEVFEVDTKEYGRIEVVGIDAIAALPPVNPKPYEDAISLSEAIERFKNTEDAEHCKWTLQGILDELNDLPSVIPKPKTGHWILRDDINGQYQCDECGMFSGLSEFDVEEEGWELGNFCSNCGARMEVSE